MPLVLGNARLACPEAALDDLFPEMGSKVLWDDDPEIPHAGFVAE
jgi:hypothetical protein